MDTSRSIRSFERCWYIILLYCDCNCNLHFLLFSNVYGYNNFLEKLLAYHLIMKVLIVSFWTNKNKNIKTSRSFGDTFLIIFDVPLGDNLTEELITKLSY